MDNANRAERRWNLLTWCLVILPLVYLLSSGPVLALAFYLRETTHEDRFYLVMWLYYPLLIWGHNGLTDRYIGWWVLNVFHTIGPG